MAANYIPVPQPLDVSQKQRSNSFDIFKQTWENYEVATGLREKPEPQRAATLLSIIGHEALVVYNAFAWQTSEERNVETILEKFRLYCQPKLNTSYERFVFLSRKQKINEPVDDFVVALRNLVKNCQYGSLADEMIRDAIVLGIRNKRTQERLLRENALTLDSAINIVRATERAQIHASNINQRTEMPEEAGQEMRKPFLLSNVPWTRIQT